MNMNETVMVNEMEIAKILQNTLLVNFECKSFNGNAIEIEPAVMRPPIHLHKHVVYLHKHIRAHRKFFWEYLAGEYQCLCTQVINGLHE